MKNYIFCWGLILLVTSCVEKKSPQKTNQEKLAQNTSVYQGSASITRGIAKTMEENVYECEGGRITNLGIIQSTDGKEWTVPASTYFKDQNFPFASDLYNACNGQTHSNVQEAITKLEDQDIITIDVDGNLYTAFIFADNYFEMYINGMAVGKDKVPFTPFNSSIVRFKVARPFTVAMKLVDWEENLGLGSESMGGSPYHAGDGGMVAVIKDIDHHIVATTNENWKAQTFYTAPVKDLGCVTESGLIQTSVNCDHTDSDDGASYFALHWTLPSDWEKENFNDSAWPNASTYSNAIIGVDNKKAYTNFTDIFDDPSNDAKFIWSSNVILDNEVIVRYTVQ